ncbi:MAG: glycosyltransferase [Hyphomicrobiales bacterium]|nr:glycosyltransferase [Hyphomicrobiales bacterium]MDE2115438.1 glycosyltransferase [Hyphomicrobiales bacterium]
MISDTAEALLPVCTIMVTRNRVDLLARAIAAVLAQSAPCQLLVIDNQSSDGTAQYLQKMAQSYPDRVKFRSLARNVGGAGGFHHGLRQAYSEGFALFWLLDDDAMADPQALARLLAARQTREQAGNPAAFYCSKVLWRDGSLCQMNIPRPATDTSTPPLPAHLRPVRDATFVSLLLDRAVLQQYGLPFAQYFIWFDDTDFTRRLSRHAPGILCLDSIVVHETASNEPFALTNASKADVWKYAYGLRNETSHIGATLGLRACLQFIGRTLKMLAGSALAAQVKAKLSLALLRGLFFRPAIEFPSPGGQGQSHG